MKLNRIVRIPFFLFFLGAAGCMSSNRLINKKITGSAMLSNHFTGFALYDLTHHRTLAGKNGSLYFTPASNTKLFTFYTALNVLGDSIPGLQYMVNQDSLIFWGTGDPSFLNASLDNHRVFDFLKSSPEKLVFSYGRYTGSFFGSGWQWDDYTGDYQPEITELPLYENSIHVSNVTGRLQVSPPTLSQHLHTSPVKGVFTVQRKELTNEFTVPAQVPPAAFKQMVPMHVDSSTLFRLLQDTLKVPLLAVNRPVPQGAKTLFSIPADTLYRHMLQPSDNFIAEHLLLVCASASGIEMNTAKMISVASTRYLAGLPDAPKWADGSGLSRMNLFTPRDMIWLLQQLYKKVNNEERLFGLLSAGGRSGTLKTMYKAAVPFVFGKTGSLSNNYNQAGYILTKKGNRLAFSFMNNNFTAPSAAVKAEMEQLITFIRDRY